MRQVVNELRGEKVDIVPYSADPPEFVMRALAPAKVREVRIHEDTGIAEVIVPDFQLSLAIGKEGQNARLAARLTGWRVDIKSETQLAEEEAGGGYAEGEWVEGPDGQLMWQPAEGRRGDQRGRSRLRHDRGGDGRPPEARRDAEDATEAGAESRASPRLDESPRVPTAPGANRVEEEARSKRRREIRADGAAPHMRRLPPDRPARRVDPDCGDA